MNGRDQIVQNLIDRLSSKLPYRSGLSLVDSRQDEVLATTTQTISQISRSAFKEIFDGLIGLLDELSTVSRFDPDADEVVESKQMIIELLADCCNEHWSYVDVIEEHSLDGDGTNGAGRPGSVSTTSSPVPGREADVFSAPTSSLPGPRRSHDALPPSLESSQAAHALGVLTQLITTVPEDGYAPLSMLLDIGPWALYRTRRNRADALRKNMMESGQTRDLDRAAFEVIEYISAANWPMVFSFLQGKLRTLRNMGQAAPAQHYGLDASGDSENSALRGLHILPHLFMNSKRLCAVLHEICGCFLNLRKSAQMAITILFSGSIASWIDNHPDEFVELHASDNRLDGGADALFDMSNSLLDDQQRRGFVWPFQAALLLLIPEVFWVAGDLRDSKSTQIAKRAAFLEGLRKNIRSSRNSNTAIRCLVGLCNAAHHFPSDSDSAFYSYVLDIQNDLREEVFKLQTPLDAQREDLSLMVAVFVSLTRLNLDSVLEILVPRVMTRETRYTLKLAAFGGCAVIACQPDREEFKTLYRAVGPFIQTSLAGAQSEIAESENEVVPPHADILRYWMFEFLAARPVTAFEAMSEGGRLNHENLNRAFHRFKLFLASSDDRTRKLAESIARRLVFETSQWWMRRSQDLSPYDFLLQFWGATFLMLSTFTLTLLDPKVTENAVETLSLFIRDFLERRHVMWRAQKKVEMSLEEAADIIERVGASADLETALLVLLCSRDLRLCSAVTTTLSIFCAGERQGESSLHTALPSLAILQNFQAYSELSTSDSRLTGVVAFQKRLRKMLSRFTAPTPGILSAWQRIFERWKADSLALIRASQNRSRLQPRLWVEWRNYSGLLASLGGFCLADAPIIAQVEDAAFAALKWIDKPASENAQPLVEQFLVQCLQLLFCDDVRVRESIIEILGTELSTRLYGHLFQVLEAYVSQVFGNPQDNPSTQYQILVLEQLASLLRVIVDRSEELDDSVLSLDFGALTLNLARPVQMIDPDPAVYRLKIRICQLCEAVTAKRDSVRLRHNFEVRGQLFEILVSWMSYPGAKRKDTLNSGRSRLAENARLQRDLDRNCIRTAVHLTHQLPLKAPEGATEIEAGEARTKLFHDHFHRFFAWVSYDSGDQDSINRRRANMTRSNRDDMLMSEHAINVLSNLLSANIDIGLKQSLEMGYHENLETRSAYLKVLRNILNEGGGLERLSEGAVSEHYEALLSLFVEDTELVIALCDSCPSNEVDEITIMLLNIFHSRGMGLSFLRTVLEHEVAITESQSELLRRNCVATKLLTIYAKWYGNEYLKATLQHLITTLFNSPEDLSLELDPNRAGASKNLEIQRNALNLRDTAGVVVESIIRSADKLPLIFRKICNIITNVVAPRFPDAKFTAVGSFIFLRFFCPAIVAPESEGLVTTTPTKEMRRGLLLIGKVVQNLANNVLFGAKEPYMAPLNDFLAHNIYDVTAYLRIISTPFKRMDPEPPSEVFDFGSGAVLHRFFYNHWDTIKLKLLDRNVQIQEQASTDQDSQAHVNLEETTIKEVESILPTLGPPPSDLPWTRPSILANTPPTYARFQEFMLKHVHRNGELAAWSHVVYDGGESLDGMPVVCIINRNCYGGDTDNSLIMFGFLKAVSKMWHRPFALLIDVTFYNMPIDYNDMLIGLELLAPSEFKNLRRIYIYNMNSTYRKSLRRVLRHTLKEGSVAFSPKNVEFCLPGNPQELQTHFDLQQFVLPNDTVTVDSRFTFQPVVRLSRTKGKVEIIIRIGGQYVQITTLKKQEVIPELRLSTTVNDIFHIKDLEEASAKTQTEDENAFGLRTENGKVIMFFTSPRKSEILQALKTTKARYHREASLAKPSERHVTPEDIPGTLLHIALMNLASNDESLRGASYNLLFGLCKAFNFSIEKEFLSAQGLEIPPQSVSLVVGVSKRLATTEPHLTSDFLTEFFVAWDKAPHQQRSLNMLFMTPWLRNLRRHVLLPEPDGEVGRERVGKFTRKLIDMATQDTSLSTAFQQHVWSLLGEDEVIVDLLLDDMIKIGTAADPENVRADRVAMIATSLGSSIVQGKIITRFRRMLNRSSLRPTRDLAENAVWDEICFLLHISLSVSFGSGAQSYLYLPELFHIITMVANSGSSATRRSVHKLLVNTVHAMGTSFPLNDAALAKLRLTLASLSEPKAELLFTLNTISSGDGPEPNTLSIQAMEAIATLLLEIIDFSAPSVSIANQWRSRWMSLVAGTAFQTNPAIQPRAFTVMGCLIRDNVDDDLLYQVLVSLRQGVREFVDNNDSDLLISILFTLTRMLTGLSSPSRYTLQLFWLGILLARQFPAKLFSRAAMFLDAVVRVLGASGELKDKKMTTALLKGKAPVEDSVARMEHLLGLRFTKDNFHAAAGACLLRGLSDPSTREVSLKVGATLLDLSSSSNTPGERFPKDYSTLPILGLLASHATTPERRRECLRIAGVDMQGPIPSTYDIFSMINLNVISDKDLLLVAVIGILGLKGCEDEAQQRFLEFLNRVAMHRGPVFQQLYGPVGSILNGVLSATQTTLALKAGQALACTITARRDLADIAQSTAQLEASLAEIGLSGIWACSSFDAAKELQRKCGPHIGKLIELIVS